MELKQVRGRRGRPPFRGRIRWLTAVGNAAREGRASPRWDASRPGDQADLGFARLHPSAPERVEDHPFRVRRYRWPAGLCLWVQNVDTVRGQDQATQQRRNDWPVKRIVELAAVALATAWLVAFIVSNSQTVKVSFVFGDVSVTLIWVMIICVVLGAAILFAIPRVLRRRR